MTEEERIFSGKLFAPAAPELAKKKEKAHRLSQDYNSLYETDSDKRNKILQELIAEIGEGTSMLGPILPYKNWTRLLYEFQFHSTR